jgi:hypothetical protein
VYGKAEVISIVDSWFTEVGCVGNMGEDDDSDTSGVSTIPCGMSLRGGASERYMMVKKKQRSGDDLLTNCEYPAHASSCLLKKLNSQTNDLANKNGHAEDIDTRETTNR